MTVWARNRSNRVKNSRRVLPDGVPARGCVHPVISSNFRFQNRAIALSTCEKPRKSDGLFDSAVFMSHFAPLEPNMPLQRLESKLPNTLARTQRELARALGKSQPTIARWIADGRWPFNRVGPWDVSKVRAWIPKALDVDPAASSSAGLTHLQAANLMIKIEKGKLLKREREIQEGKFHDADACRMRRVRQVYEVRCGLLALPGRIARELVGKSADEIELVLSDAMKAICRAFASAPTPPAVAGVTLTDTPPTPDAAPTAPPAVA